MYIGIKFKVIIGFPYFELRRVKAVFLHVFGKCYWGLHLCISIRVVSNKSQNTTESLLYNGQYYEM